MVKEIAQQNMYIYFILLLNKMGIEYRVSETAAGWNNIVWPERIAVAVAVTVGNQ